MRKPCLYSGTINGNRIIFKRQVDDFAIAAPDPQTADILLDMLNDKMTMPVKQQGLLNMFNSIDVIQTRHYVKIDCHTYISKFCKKYLDSRGSAKSPSWQINQLRFQPIPRGSRNSMPLPAQPICMTRLSLQKLCKLSIEPALVNSSGP